MATTPQVVIGTSASTSTTGQHLFTISMQPISSAVVCNGQRHNLVQGNQLSNHVVCTENRMLYSQSLDAPRNVRFLFSTGQERNNMTRANGRYHGLAEGQGQIDINYVR